MDLSSVALSVWAKEEFSHARLGDSRRTERLVRIAERAAQHPAGTVTEVFANHPQERDAAYDFLENTAISSDAIAGAHHHATAKRCQGFPFVFVPVDGSSLQFADDDGSKGLGSIGTHKAGARGLKVMSAIAVSPEGVPLGVVGQAWWLRKGKASIPHAKRKVQDKETRYWLEVQAQAQQALSEEAPGVEPWFQCDREADSWPVLLEAFRESFSRYTTIRANRDRCLALDPEGEDDTKPGDKLQHALLREPAEAFYTIDVRGGPKRKAREARMALRFREVTLKLRDQWTNRGYETPLFAVWAREEGTTPPGEKPVDWLLLTTYAVDSVQDACLVLFGYAQRWRIEDYHAALKDRGCAVEDSQLRSEAALRKWATTLSAVAMRLLRLTYLGRKHPNQPASVELSQAECHAVVCACELKTPAESLTIGEAVQGLANLGGYVGPGSGGPPGFMVLRRGLQQIQVLARVLARNLTI
jgi:hypothetical protein